MEMIWSLDCREYKTFWLDAFIMDTQEEIEKTIVMFLSKKNLCWFDMLKSNISALNGGP